MTLLVTGQNFDPKLHSFVLQLVQSPRWNMPPRMYYKVSDENNAASELEFLNLMSQFNADNIDVAIVFFPTVDAIAYPVDKNGWNVVGSNTNISTSSWERGLDEVYQEEMVHWPHLWTKYYLRLKLIGEWFVKYDIPYTIITQDNIDDGIEVVRRSEDFSDMVSLYDHMDRSKIVHWDTCKDDLDGAVKTVTGILN